MADDEGSALELARELCDARDSARLPAEVRALVTAADREVIATILLGELAQRIGRETTTAGYQQNGRA